jgi:Zn-dependent protease with chaperone function
MLYTAPVRTGFLCLLAAGALPAQFLKLTDPQEIEVGKKAAAEVEFAQPLFTDAKSSAFLEKIGLRLARESQRPGLRFSFKILDSDDVNAYALPGGFIYVTRGLVESVRTENELAAAVAHEIGHIAARQHAAKIRRSQLAALGVSFLGPAAGGGMKVAAASRGGRNALRGLFMRFTREDEMEADRIGAALLRGSGYDPEGMLRFLHRLSSLQEDDPKLVRGYFRSHTGAGERAERVAEWISAFPARSYERQSDAEFLRIRAHIAEVKPKGAMPSSDAAAAVVEAATEGPESQAARDREVAALFAPQFFQALGEDPRYDYITSFDFDGDWRGDNNWENAAKKEYPLKAWVYYTVRETRTHYFIHYAVFHPRDYKGGAGKGRFLSRVIRTATKPAAAIDPTGRALEAVLAHENDLEGCLVVVEKRGEDPGEGRVAFLQTLAHNNFLKYVPADAPRDGFETFQQSGRSVKLFIEPKGHGIEAYRPESGHDKHRLLRYLLTGRAETPERSHTLPVGYNLVPIETTLWPEAKRGVTPTYAEIRDFGSMLLDMAEGDGVKEVVWEAGQLGAAFRGTVGGANLARPPWGWFDSKDNAQPPGQWFFDPARVIRRDYSLEGFSTAYLREWPAPEEREESPE